MTINISVNVGGAVRQLRNAVKNANDAVAKSLIAAGYYVEGEVKESIAGHRDETRSVDKGRFLNSIKVSRKGETAVVVQSNLDYPIYLEEGTQNIRPRRHFKNSLYRSKPKIVEIFQSEVKKVK